MSELLTSPLFPLEGLSPQTLVKLPTTPLAASGSVKLYVIFAEPRLYLEGFNKTEMSRQPPSVLRGCLFIRVSKPVRVKSISLKLQGVARTEWPEGIPPSRNEHLESNVVLSHTWTFFNSANTYPVTEHTRMNADLYVAKTEGSDLDSFSLDSTLSPVSSNASISDHSLHSVKSPSSFVSALIGGALSPSQSHTQELRDPLSPTSSLRYPPNSDSKMFVPGDYIYSFEQLFPASLPESSSLTFGGVSYFVDATLERSGAFKSNLYAHRVVEVIRAPSVDSSEENEPILINRSWEDKLQYEILISSKMVILNSYLPLSFKLAPLDKICVHRMRVYIMEHLEYYCHHKHVHRAEPPKKILLLEHKPPEGMDNLLSVGEDEIGGAQLDFQLYLPERYGDHYKIHPDTRGDDIISHHWIKISLRLSKANPTAEDPKKRKFYELSIDSPLLILSPHCAHANTLLPSYDEQMQQDVGAPLTTSSSVATDLNMTARSDMILASNLYQPDATIPVEFRSPQARPFSPLVSPELNAINPELRLPNEMKPIDLLRTLSMASPPPDPVLGPPPPFEAAAKDVPPTYEEALRNSSSSAEASSASIAPSLSTTNSSSSSSTESRGRSRTTRDRNSSADLGDMDGNFRLQVRMIRSRSPSGSPPPTFSGASPRSKLVSSSVVPGFYFHSMSSGPSAHAIDEAFDNPDDESGPSPNSSPKGSPAGSPAASPKLSPRSEVSPTSHKTGNTLSPSSSATLTLTPPRRSDAGSSLLDFEGIVARQPLLADSHSELQLERPTFYNHSSEALRNGSVITDLGYARDPQHSVDVTQMLGSAIDRSISPVGISLADPSEATHVPAAWTASSESFGVKPIIDTLSKHTE